MTKKHFIALANHIKNSLPYVYTPQTIESLADFCMTQNTRFDRDKWLNYIAGLRSPN